MGRYFEKKLLIIARKWVLTNKLYPASCRHPELLALAFVTHPISVETASVCVDLIRSNRFGINMFGDEPQRAQTE